MEKSGRQIEVDYYVSAGSMCSEFLERGKMPLVADTVQDSLLTALKPCGINKPEQARIIRIKNILTLDEMWASTLVVEELRGQAYIELEELTPL